MPAYMDRLNEIKQQIFGISSLDDYLNALSAASLIAKEMTEGQPTPEESDLLERICAVLERDPRTVSNEQEE